MELRGRTPERQDPAVVEAVEEVRGLQFEDEVGDETPELGDQLVGIQGSFPIAPGLDGDGGVGE